jgi:ribosomal protein L11 methylase PrmA
MVRAAIYDEIYEAQEAEIVRATLRSDDSVLDLGCGTGLITTIAASLTSSLVRSYDANPAMVDVARQTLQLNGATASVAAAVLQNSPSVEEASFFRGLPASMWSR